MDIKASAPRKGCLSSNIRRLELKTERQEEQVFLAALFAALASGGIITVRRRGHRTESMQFPEMNAKPIYDVAKSADIKHKP